MLISLFPSFSLFLAVPLPLCPFLHGVLYPYVRVFLRPALVGSADTDEMDDLLMELHLVSSFMREVSDLLTYLYPPPPPPSLYLIFLTLHVYCIRYFSRYLYLFLLFFVSNLKLSVCEGVRAIKMFQQSHGNSSLSLSLPPPPSQCRVQSTLKVWACVFGWFWEFGRKFAVEFCARANCE